ncbi:SAM-dependent methyltransferase [Actinoalloteichus hoggarensis]|uniref:Malonyl-[acyl-carrier protein] O-methyltransferase n=1 Tax=Actinoalloteichus hoggarensis TaxID=1470176 RepID=A0A221W6L1_9PSEU|nr:class I SAM-dependent methyltransferase [Actinoalloteichus hoggarensis]ASO21209.1 Malonyl-[acyl-carrier protein] O-methyltransferase [Actinoalloteichus hoggarensis]MBB5921139.1 SAM-dependent methyltransferase [Actinoalloteichus hoggarensis]
MTEPPFLSATRTAYDAVAVDYAELLTPELREKPLDRAMLAAFAELVRAAGLGPIADVGCGPGRVTAHLDALDVSVFGIDLSPGMVEVARKRNPGLRFEVGSMTSLDLPDGELGGVLAWYSIIHVPPELLPTVFAEFHRVSAPGGHLLLAFQTGDERRHIEQAYGHTLSYDAYRLPPEHIASLLTEAGFVVTARLIREPDLRWDRVPQAYVLATKPTAIDEKGLPALTAGRAASSRGPR